MASISRSNVPDDVDLLEATSRYLKSLRKGCLCHESNEGFAAYIHRGCLLLRNLELDKKDCRRQLLCFLSFTSALTKTTLLTTSHADEKNVVCKRLHAWLIVLRKIKFYLLSGLLTLSRVQNDAHVANTSQSTFNHLLTLLPCPMISPSLEENCKKLCHPVVNHLMLVRQVAQLSSSSSLACASFCDIDQQISSLKKGLTMSCSSGTVITIPCGHFKSLNKCLVQNLRNNWKTWTEVLHSCDDFLFKQQSFSLWKALVDVKSNMSLHQAREFVSSVKNLVDLLPLENEALVKRKWLEIFCEVLCYGSTLGIQSDVPSEVSDIAHKLVRQSKTEGLSTYEVPNVYLGLAGDRVIPTEENEEMDQVPDLIILQGVALIHLKAVALLVREAQSCSSSDDSDCSLSSRGSSSVAEEEREMKMIEKNVIELLSKLRSWINEILGLPTSTSLTASIITLFNEQDDGLIEALLCLLDTHSGFQFGTYTARVGVSCGQAPEDDESLDFFNPIDGFEGFLQAISHDSSVILDFLLSNETCFLLYFLRILKYLNKTSVTSGRAHPARPVVYQTLNKVLVSMKKLTGKNLFPYDIKPVQKLLEKLFSNEESI